METLINAWLSIWLYVLTGIGIVLGFLVYRNRKTWSKLDIYGALVIIVLVLHVLEEWVLPGGLHYTYNIANGGTVLSTFPMNRLTDMITNFGAVILGCIVLKFWGFKKPAGITLLLFCCMEVFMHIAIGIQDLNIFREYGMNTVYSPGIITSLFGFLPVGILLAIELFKAKPRPTILHWIIGIVATVALAFLLINLPEMLLGTEDSPYKFTNRGYYEQYHEQFEADQNYKY